MRASVPSPQPSSRTILPRVARFRSVSTWRGASSASLNKPYDSTSLEYCFECSCNDFCFIMLVKTPRLGFEPRTPCGTSFRDWRLTRLDYRGNTSRKPNLLLNVLAASVDGDRRYSFKYPGPKKPAWHSSAANTQGSSSRWSCCCS